MALALSVSFLLASALGAAALGRFAVRWQTDRDGPASDGEGVAGASRSPWRSFNNALSRIYGALAGSSSMLLPWRSSSSSA